MESSLPHLLTDRLEHLPPGKIRQLRHVLRILFEEFETARKSHLNEHRIRGRILKIILYGSHARGGWVRDLATGYRSDFDLLVIVSNEIFTDDDYWYEAYDRIARELEFMTALWTPVSVAVHSLQDVNDQLSRGRPFFIDILRDGIPLYEASRSRPLAKPKPLTPEAIKTEAAEYYQQWMDKAEYSLKLTDYSMADKQLNHAAFNLHQTVEALYHCLLLTVTLYSPKLHDLWKLRKRVDSLDPRLQDVWPRDSKLARTAFAQLWKAYVEARYSPVYEITEEQLRWLRERTLVLFELVRDIAGSRVQP